MNRLTKVIALKLAVLVLSASLPALAVASEVKVNSPCSQLGRSIKSSVGTLLCTKVTLKTGSKLVYRLQRSVPVKVSVVSKESSTGLTPQSSTPVTTSTTPTSTEPTTTNPTAKVRSASESTPEANYNSPIFIFTGPLQPNSPAPGRFCLDPYNRVSFNNEVLICLNGVWTRQLGVRVTKSNPPQDLTKKNLITEDKVLEDIILKDWSGWKSAKRASSDLDMDIILGPGYNKEWEDITRNTVNYTASILNANGLKLTQKTRWVFIESEEERVKEYNSFYENSTCRPPYLPNADKYITIYCATNDIGSGGVGKPGMAIGNNYKLTAQDKLNLAYTIAHDLAIFYLVQAQYGSEPYHGREPQIPAWIREGTAQLIAHLVVNDLYNSSSSYVNLSSTHRWISPKPESICSRDLQDAEGRDKLMPDNCSQGMNIYAVTLLIANHGSIRSLFNFSARYGVSDDWLREFEEVFQVSREEFYKEWWSYLGIPSSQWPDLLPPTPAERY